LCVIEDKFNSSNYNFNFNIFSVIGILGTIVFFLLATSASYKASITQAVVTSLYSPSMWRSFKKSGLFEVYWTAKRFQIMIYFKTQLLQVHILAALGVQIGLGLASLMLLIGICKRIRCLILPWLIIFIPFQMILLMSVLASVIYLPPDLKVIKFNSFLKYNKKLVLLKSVESRLVESMLYRIQDSWVIISVLQMTFFTEFMIHQITKNHLRLIRWCDRQQVTPIKYRARLNCLLAFTFSFYTLFMRIR